MRFLHHVSIPCFPRGFYPFLFPSAGVSHFFAFGTDTAVSCDYPVYGYRAAKAVASGECDRGILICGTGIGIGIAASKVKGTRVCTCSDVYSAELSKRHNNSNILTMGARVVGVDLAKMIATHWLTAEFEGGRHQRRIDMITAIENGEEL